MSLTSLIILYWARRHSHSVSGLLLAKPRLPVMMRLIETIISSGSTNCHKLRVSQSQSLYSTSMRLSAVLAPVRSQKLFWQRCQERLVTTVTWELFHDLTEAKLVGGSARAYRRGILLRALGIRIPAIMEARVFWSSTTIHASSWPTNHPRYKHAIYGEIEKVQLGCRVCEAVGRQHSFLRFSSRGGAVQDHSNKGNK